MVYKSRDNAQYWQTKVTIVTSPSGKGSQTFAARVLDFTQAPVLVTGEGGRAILTVPSKDILSRLPPYSANHKTNKIGHRRDCSESGFPSVCYVTQGGKRMMWTLNSSEVSVSSNTRRSLVFRRSEQEMLT